MRILLILLLVFALAPLISAQPKAVYSAASLPSAETLDRANLKTEWMMALPVATRNDGVLMVQAVDEHQVYVQTRAGVLVAIDARTGAQQWMQKFDTIPATVYPVAANEKFVVAVNLLKLYCIDRYTGAIEFAYPLPFPPSAAPVIDGNLLFVTLKRDRIYAMELPKPVSMPEKLAKVKRGLGDLASSEEVKRPNPADDVIQRYGSESRALPKGVDRFEARRVILNEPFSAGSATAQRTPSLAAVATVRPPYRAFDQDGHYLERSESLSTIATLRQPYSLHDSTSQIQRSPSLAMTQNLRSLNQISSLAPAPYRPQQLWVYGSTQILIAPPLVTDYRLWMFSDSPIAEAVTKLTRLAQVRGRLPAIPTAPAAQAEDIAYVPLSEGSLVALDMTYGGDTAIKTIWKANVSGPLNRKPLLTSDSVYIGGDTSGVARIDRQTGDVTWRTDTTADTVVAVNAEHVYVRDKVGRLRVYDRTRVRSNIAQEAVELASADLSGFNAMAQNQQTDRIFAASDNGLLLCLRDKSSKYAVPMKIAPPLHVKAPDLTKKPADAATMGEEKKAEEPKPDAKN